MTFSSGPGGEHSTMVMGEGRKPGRTHLLSLGKKLGIKKYEEIVDQVHAAISLWEEFADIAGVSEESKNLIKENIR